MPFPTDILEEKPVIALSDCLTHPPSTSASNCLLPRSLIRKGTQMPITGLFQCPHLSYLQHWSRTIPFSDNPFYLSAAAWFLLILYCHFTDFPLCWPLKCEFPRVSLLDLFLFVYSSQMISPSSMVSTQLTIPKLIFQPPSLSQAADLNFQLLISHAYLSGLSHTASWNLTSFPSIPFQFFCILNQLMSSLSTQTFPISSVFHLPLFTISNWTFYIFKT